LYLFIGLITARTVGREHLHCVYHNVYR